MHQTTRKAKSALFLAAAFILSGLSFAFAEPALQTKDSGAIQSLDTLAGVTAVQAGAELPVPVVTEIAQDEQELFAEKAGAATPACTPNPLIQPGKDFSPKVNDEVRTTAIIGLLNKIANCKPLQFKQDGVVNNNNEGGMPQAPKGYYHEYTLMVPGRQTGDGAVPVNIGGTTYMTGTMQSARGPERIIIGGGEFIYYTMDHYKTFVKLTIVK